MVKGDLAESDRIIEWCLSTLLARDKIFENLDLEQIRKNNDGDLVLEIDCKINGIETEFSSLMIRFAENFKDQVEKYAEEIVKKRCNRLWEIMEDLEQELKLSIKSKP